ATLLREHRGDGHNAALVVHGVGGTEAHVLFAVSLGMRAEEFGRIHHLGKAQLAAVVDGLRGRGLVDAGGGFTDAGRETRQRIEALTDELAAPAYDVLSADELDELIAGLEPVATAVEAVDY
ncbi:helix-turn-helix domain-containing protein, partial [Dactylosporangium sucinum]